MTAQKKEISLLPTEEFEKTRLGRFLKWALSFGRWIVILTELIVILCFLSRFKLDRDLTDLGDKIKEQQAIIASFGDLEENFRNLQKRLATVDQLEKEQLLTSTLLAELSETIPLDVSLDEMTVKEKEIEISGLALSEAGFGSLIKELDKSEKFKRITLHNVSKEETGAIKFKLTTKLGD